MASQAHAVVSDYFSGQGVVMLAERDGSGNPTGFTPVGNVSDLKLSVSTSDYEHKESTTGARGVDLTFNQETNVAISMVMESITPDNLALALYGETSAVASGSVVGSTAFTGYLGKVLILNHIKVSNVVVKDAAEVVTYEVDKNYYVNEEAGSIHIFTDAEQTAKGAAANITDAQELHIGYDYAASNELDAMTQAAPIRWLRFEGLNTVDGNSPVVIDVFKFSTKPLAELALINDEVAQMQVDGNALMDALRTVGSKYFRVRKV